MNTYQSDTKALTLAILRRRSCPITIPASALPLTFWRNAGHPCEPSFCRLKLCPHHSPEELRKRCIESYSSALFQVLFGRFPVADNEVLRDMASAFLSFDVLDEIAQFTLVESLHHAPLAEVLHALPNGTERLLLVFGAYAMGNGPWELCQFLHGQLGQLMDVVYEQVQSELTDDCDVGSIATYHTSPHAVEPLEFTPQLPNSSSIDSSSSPFDGKGVLVSLGHRPDSSADSDIGPSSSVDSDLDYDKLAVLRLPGTPFSSIHEWSLHDRNASHRDDCFKGRAAEARKLDEVEESEVMRLLDPKDT